MAARLHSCTHWSLPKAQEPPSVTLCLAVGLQSEHALPAGQAKFSAWLHSITNLHREWQNVMTGSAQSHQCHKQMSMLSGAHLKVLGMSWPA